MPRDAPMPSHEPATIPTIATTARDRRRGLAWGFLGVASFSLTLPATRVAVAGLDPVFVGLGRAVVVAVLAATVLAAALLLGEAIDPATFVAAALVIAAIAVGRRAV